MPIVLQSAAGPNVTARNPFDVLYITGDSETDGSIRIIIGDDGVSQVQKLADGVWNATELELSRGSLLLGREVRLAAAGHHLVVEASVEDLNLIVPGAHFDDNGSDQPHAPAVDVLQTRVVSQSDDSNDVELAAHLSDVTVLSLALINTLYLKTGATAATDDVVVKFTEGVPPDDAAFFLQRYPATTFPANTEVQLDAGLGIEFVTTSQINVRVESDTAFGILYNAAGTEFWMACDVQDRADVELLTENLVYDENLEHVLDESLNPVYASVF